MQVYVTVYGSKTFELLADLLDILKTVTYKLHVTVHGAEIFKLLDLFDILKTVTYKLRLTVHCANFFFFLLLADLLDIL